MTIREGRVDFLNPSVRDFLAAVISASWERVRDILEGATRFRQVSGLWQLSGQPRYVELRRYLLRNANLLFSALTRLMAVPYLHWRKEERGMFGTHYDTSPFARVQLAISLANLFRTPESLAIVTLAFEALFEGWKSDGAILTEVLSLIEDLRKSEWVYKHAPQEIERTLIEEFLLRLDDALADDWLTMLRVTRKSSFLTSEEQTALEEALIKYQSTGALRERNRCDDVREAEDLKQSLELLRDTYDCSVEYEIGLLEQDIEENSKPEREQEDFKSSWTPPNTYEPPATDDSLRQMFSTLLD